MIHAIRLLGIDPGLRRTGWGMIEATGNRLSFIASGTVTSDNKKSLAERLVQLHDGLSEVVRQHEPSEAAVEHTFVNKDAGATLKLGQARGIALLVPSLAGLPVAEYAPRTIKQAVVGRGGADKEQVQHMVQSLLKLPGKPQADAADALAIAICHAHTSASLVTKAGVKGVTRGRMR